MKNIISYAVLSLMLLSAVTVPASAQAIQPPASVEQTQQSNVKNIVVVKSERKMYMLDEYDNVIRTYQIALGNSPVGHKEKEGDGKTPEGKYFIDFLNTNSEFFLSMRISYPSPVDQERARKAGVNPGGAIFIHGEPPDRNWKFWKYSNKKDWTQGCVAVNNNDIQEIWKMVPKGTPVIIQP